MNDLDDMYCDESVGSTVSCLSNWVYLEEDEDTTEEESDGPQAFLEEDTCTDPTDGPERELVHVQHALGRSARLRRRGAGNGGGALAEHRAAVGMVSEEAEAESDASCC